MPQKHPGQKRYPDELKRRAVDLVLEIKAKDPSDHNAISRVARQLDVGVESLRVWVKRAEVDAGRRPGTTSADAARLAELEKENRELRRTNEILKAASAFFATELDGRQKR